MKRQVVRILERQIAADIVSDSLPQTLQFLGQCSPQLEDVNCPAPIFVFSAGWRSGSTLLQRLICSAGGTLIWGEPFGDRAPVCRLAQTIYGLNEADPHMRYSIDKFTGDLSGQWVANLNPGTAPLRSAHLAFFESFLAAPAFDHGFQRWGAKWVNLTAFHAEYLKWLYPKAKLIFLVRHPLDAFHSYKNKDWSVIHGRHQVRGVIRFIAHWNYLANSFLSERSRLGALLVRYEDLVSRTETFDELQCFLELEFDRSVLSKKLDATKKASLSWWDRFICARYAGSTCRALGYPLRGGAPLNHGNAPLRTSLHTSTANQ